MQRAHLSHSRLIEKSLPDQIHNAEYERRDWALPGLQVVVGLLILYVSPGLYELTPPFAVLTAALGVLVGIAGLRQLLKH